MGMVLATMNITRKLTITKLQWKRTHNLTMIVQSKWLAEFSCLLLDSDSVSYCNIYRKYSDFVYKKSLMFIGKIVDRMDTYLPTSHLESMKTPLKLNA